MEEAKRKRDEAMAEVDSRIHQVQGLILDKADEGTLNDALGKLNEAASTLSDLHLEYITSISHDSQKEGERPWYDSIDGDVKKTAEYAANYLHDRDVVDHESVSQVSGKRSNASSARAKAATRRAQLVAESRVIERKHALEMAEQKLKQEREKLKLDTLLAQTTAEVEILAELEDEERSARQSQSGSENEVTFKENPQQPQTQTGVLYKQQQQLIDIIQAPKVEIPFFDGDPLTYYIFIRAFEENVERVVKDSASRLSRLMQYCTGKAKRLLQCCAIMNPKDGYPKARALLKQRFGNEFVISQAWIDSVTANGVIKANDGHALQSFGDDLRNCLETLEAMNCMSEINTQTSLLKIIDRLPTFLQNRWRRQVMELKRREHRLPRLADVVVFVEMAAEEVTDPIYGSLKQSEKSQDNEKSHPKPKRQASYNAEVKPSSDGVKCAICNGSHWITACETFKAMQANERFEATQKRGLCFNCLRANHNAKQCRSDRRCSVNGCGRKHSTFLHRANKPSAAKPNATNMGSEATTHGAPTNVQNGYVETSCFTGTSVKRIALPIVAVKVKAPDSHKSVKTYALLDSGSTNTFCSVDLLNQLGVAGKKETVSLTTLERAESVFHTRVASLEVMDIYGTEALKLPAVYAKQNLPIHEENIATTDDVTCWPHLRGLDLPLADTDQVQLLIGQDCPDALIPITVIAGRRGEPYATKSILGWSLNGPLKNDHGNRRMTCHFLTARGAEDDRLTKQVEQFWKLESSGLYEEEQAMSVNDRRVIDRWDMTTSYQDGHYKMEIPFKDSNVKLPDDKQMALTRLKSLGRKLDKDPNLKDKYVSGINDLMKKGYATEVPDKELCKSDGKVWYLPHHPVINPQKEKVRIVFDCAAKYMNISLNSQVLPGPDLTNKLVGVLMRFRLHKVAFMADIEAMFHQVRVASEDQDVLRFLWWPGGDTSLEAKAYKMTVHLFGGTWSPSCCNQALLKTVKDHGHAYDEETQNTVRRNFYVDDCLKSTATVSNAIILAKQLKALLKRGGFNLTKFISNEPEMLQHLPESDKSQKVRDLALDGTLSERALGVHWDVANDTLSYRIAAQDKPITKRGLLSMLSSVFDPLGFACPFVLKARKVVQDLCRQRIGWDEPIPEGSRKEWSKWVNDLPNLKQVQIPRCIRPTQYEEDVSARQLHHFADASELAYGVVSYLRTEHEQGVSCSLIMARSRLAPLKTMTIPRLELSAATLAVRQDALIRKEIGLEVKESHFWSDSTIVLQYISNENKRFKIFVANRVEVIRSGSSPRQWHHVDTKQNPADDASRGLTAGELNSRRWLNGPQFIMEAQSTWDKCAAIQELEDNDPEVKLEKAATFATSSQGQGPLDKLMLGFSSWIKLKKSVAWLLAIRKVITKVAEPIQLITTEHLEEAEREIVKFAQRKAFSAEIAALQGDEEVKSSSSIASLRPVMREGMLCVGGRLRHANVSADTKWPMIIPKDSHVANLLINYLHEKAGHAGREYVLSIIMERFWLIGARRQIRRQLNKCIRCKKRDAVPCQQLMGDLPADRVTSNDPAFTHSGVDYFGPFLVKRGRGTEKRYGCLFTCLNTRAIHIEIAHSLEADSFINALQRFIARRGKCRSLTSDNGRNFVGAERELREEIEKWNKKKVHDALSKEHIHWKFNPPLASHMGGVWERQIRTVRKVLSGLTTEQVMTDESLLTLMCVAESIVNNRPITTVSADMKDAEPLTPNHLLVMRPVESLHGAFNKDDLHSRKRWRQVQYLADLFWRRWIREYLPQLQRRPKWNKDTRDMQYGDLVLLVDCNLPRNEWLMGRVMEAYKGKDGRCRSVKIKTKGSELVRPITKVCLLEAANVSSELSSKLPKKPSFTSEE